MLEWVDQFEADTAALQLPEKLLGMDNHGAQQTTEFKAKLETVDTVPAYTPPECTDCISPFTLFLVFCSASTLPHLTCTMCTLHPAH
jgi:hypothetical protein